jgi:hypothetical protein
VKWVAIAAFAAFSAYISYGDEQDFVNHRGNYTAEKEADKEALRQYQAAQVAQDCLEDAKTNIRWGFPASWAMGGFPPRWCEP